MTKGALLGLREAAKDITDCSMPRKPPVRTRNRAVPTRDLKVQLCLDKNGPGTHTRTYTAVSVPPLRESDRTVREMSLNRDG
jgi:hypothetical protein